MMVSRTQPVLDLRCQLAVLLLAATLCFYATTAARSDEPSAPTAPQIEQLLRAQLEGKRTHLRAYWPEKGTVLEKFELRQLERLSPTQWDADLELQFQFAPPPRSVIGFQRRRAGPYWLRLEQTEHGLKLLRFSPAGRVEPLPSPIGFD